MRQSRIDTRIPVRLVLFLPGADVSTSMYDLEVLLLTTLVPAILGTTLVLPGILSTTL